MKKGAAVAVLAIIVLFFAAVIFLLAAGIFLVNKNYPLMGNAIALIEVEGPIYESKEVIRQIHKYRDSDNVNAIILRINSPGGTVGASQEIYSEIMKVREKYSKKVVVSMADLSASGGYYIACASDYIFANPGTITGSIGVIMNFTNWQVLTDKIGLSFNTIKSSKYKDIGSPNREMTEDEKALLNEMITGVYNQFLNAILATREGIIEKKWIEKSPDAGMELVDYIRNNIADGRILSGEQAYNLGLVDQLGNLQDTIDYTAKLVGIKGEPRIIKERKRPEGLADILSGKMNGIIKEIKPKSDISIEYMMKAY